MKVKEKIIILIVLLLLIVLLIIFRTVIKKEDKNNLQIYFFNAGKADAILVSKNNKYIMIDTGEELLASEILNYFKNNNITKLEYLIITHFDKDHVGSASKIIDNINIGEVLQSNYPKESEYYNNYLNSLEKENITPITVNDNYLINLEGLEIIVNGPSTIYDNNESNNSSLIVSIINSNNKFLFMGDSQNPRIKDYLEIDKNGYDFLKVPYHGHYLKRLDDIIESKNIKYAVITSSEEEKEDEKTVDILKKYNINYYLTRKGSITIISDGKDIKIKQ